MDDKKWIKKDIFLCVQSFFLMFYDNISLHHVSYYLLQSFFSAYFILYIFFFSFITNFFCVYHLLRKYHLKAKKGYVPLERSLNVSCTKKKMFHYFIFCRLSIVFVVQEEKFFASAVIRWGWHTVAGFVWIPFDPRTRKWNT